MPFVVSFREPDTFVLEVSGDLTYAVVRSAIDDLLDHPATGRARKLLIDNHRVTSAPTASELRAIAQDMKPLIERGVTVMAIVTDDALVYGVARMFGVFAEVFGLKVRAFRAMHDAEEWLRRRTP